MLHDGSLSLAPLEVDALFTSWDPDGSGALELKELEKLLRRGSSVKLDAKLQAGCAGEIELERGNKAALRTEKKDAFGRDAKLMQGVDIAVVVLVGGALLLVVAGALSWRRPSPRLGAVSPLMPGTAVSGSSS